ncbi:hypothetical protein [Methanogenium cariaci]|uniref:hypothetical protein n=1 Tax=Methanogenium cariaci TaxID=2197 RepID=UPI0012F6832B|nr:hypothetical protein [Methanogenium cariaci]
MGIDASAGSISDIADADCIVVVGNLALSHPLAARRVANARDNGAKVTVVDTYLSPTARLANEFIQAVPGNERKAVARAAEFIEGEKSYVLFGITAGDAETSIAAAALEIAEAKGATFFAFPAQSNGRGRTRYRRLHTHQHRPHQREDQGMVYHGRGDGSGCG